MTAMSNTYPQLGDDVPKKSHWAISFFRSHLFDPNDPRLFPITQKLATIKPDTSANYNIAAVIDGMSSPSLFTHITAIRSSLDNYDKNKHYLIIGYFLLAQLNKELFPLSSKFKQLVITKNSEIQVILERFATTKPSNAKDRIVIGLLLTAALREVLKKEAEAPNPNVAKLMAQSAVAVELSKLQCAMLDISKDQMTSAALFSAIISMALLCLVTQAVCLIPGFGVIPLVVLGYAIIMSSATLLGGMSLFQKIKSERHEGLSEFFEEQKTQALEINFGSDLKKDSSSSITAAQNYEEIIDNLSAACNKTVIELKL